MEDAGSTTGGSQEETVDRSLTCRVLVVDDNRDSAETLAMLLELWNYDVRVVHDGPSALREAGAYQPHVVLLDIGLPGMSGYDVATALKQRPDPGPGLLVAMTGYGRQEDRQRAREAGFDLHLVKPVAPEALEKVLADFCAKLR